MDLSKHKGHRLQIEQYGRKMELECLTCRETLQSQTIYMLDKDYQKAVAAAEMEGGCVSRGS